MRKYRTFIIAVAYLACCVFITVHTWAEKIKLRAGHVIPIDKKLSRSDIKGMFQRGERLVWADQDANTVGMPVGGIAAGPLYLRGDGTLAPGWVFNKHVFTGYGDKC